MWNLIADAVTGSQTILKRILPSRQPKRYVNKDILSLEVGNDLIRSKVASGAPIMVGKIGNGELACVFNYVQMQMHQNGNLGQKLTYSLRGFRSGWKEVVKYSINNNAGVFPNTDEILSAYSSIFLDAVANLDITQVWFNRGEEFILERYAPDSSFTHLQSIEPYFSEEPWTTALQGHRVLVIHPFTKSIEEQYKKRHLLFSNPKVLPDFELITMEAVQTRGQNETQFQNWIEALDFMKGQMKSIEFDIAIVGAGAYGLPLASYAKELGKQGIHMGGATQLLFGIRGKRWDTRPEFQPLFNEHWVRPKSEEMGGSQAKGRTGQDYW